ncbi:uncharacterized protein Z519_02851 [Cladophialophora bantiana CBS 173.52]|uniref:Uncharacterized protein n=1 Tax=Cladophialophora bantiana (strain ATCC 10958 / CBS 173.52 / CDC B-1940 / NIH 8579) TaxID=1442370 RepID=A0A0D2GB22_CLAB1|nr:uncharacterized protein Z519_02851 [Cladophialophora bantiana CBS 173.52]KIW95787.1 hypothetical protein Z519_02851 [Cladophialophora bantiana CBS 173.52]
MGSAAADEEMSRQTLQDGSADLPCLTCRGLFSAYSIDGPYRDPKTGYCVVAAFDEPGEVIASFKSMGILCRVFGGHGGYRDQNIARPLLPKVTSGNVVAIPSRDTFRWKGENLSADEVRAFISGTQDVWDVAAVVKQLKSYDGQVGAVVITFDGSPDSEIEGRFIKGLYHALRGKGLPDYALPKLVAVTNELVAVGDTFKHAKQNFKGIDWSPATLDKGTRKYWLDSEAKTSKPINAKSGATIEKGQAKL